ncbi:BLUF domain-containing protein [Rhizorhabdus dicambivorans]|nr:BLUF domain-containing protein [Rhizorhabdus dicambivorans]
MGEHMVLYTSTCLIPPAHADAELARLVEQARVRNAVLRVTGALLYSELRRFAQILEGDAHAVHALMDSIRRDARHTRVTTLYDGPLQRRMFGSWSLAYAGPSVLVDRAIEAAEFGAHSVSPRPRDDLVALMIDLARRQPSRGGVEPSHLGAAGRGRGLSG